MGYTTRFTGELGFKDEPTRAQLAQLSSFFGKDIRHEVEGAYYVQFELSPGFAGMRWDGSEKFYGAVEVVNYLTRKMREQWPNFSFVGQLAAQGEDPDDRWILKVKDDGTAVEVKTPPTGSKVKCPECDHEFYVEQ